METQVRTPQMVFMQPQRLVVPLFQRPYVWSQESQWEPLWEDVIRVTERVLRNPQDKHHPHFLGAVVLQQQQKKTGQMQERMIIDGQQRLTTLQLLLDALHGELQSIGATAPAARIQPLVQNAEPFCSAPEDQFKVWPTNRDRRPFNAVMSAPSPVDYQKVGFSGERMVEAHRYFAGQARSWLADAPPGRVTEYAGGLESVARELLQIVVIDLAADENAQEIFETLNARGAQLTAADLIKNFVFQRLIENNVDVERAYEANWKDFETGFWETEIAVGRLRYPRSALFLNHWLISRTGEEIVAREVFERFKRFADHDTDASMKDLLAQIRRSAEIYRSFVTNAAIRNGPIDALGLFGYRTGVLESEVIKPLILCLLNPEEAAVPSEQFHKALAVIESWMVRRMLVRATTKNYNQVIGELIKLISGPARTRAGDEIEKFLAGQSSGSRYWPDDNELKTEFIELPAYRRIRRGRLRMVLEALEDRMRGWDGTKAGLGGERVPRAKLAIEHVMPRKWHANWPLNGVDENDREALLHTFGNLTLLTSSLNSKVSNGPWLGAHSKHQGLESHDVLFLNRKLLQDAENEWTERDIRRRTSEIAEVIISIWPTPPGHKSGYSPEQHTRVRKILQVSDLIAGGALFPGTTLFPRRKKFAHIFGTLLADGRIEIDGMFYATPSEAAKSITGNATNGWWFFLIDQASKRSLKTVRREYVEAMAVDTDEDDQEDDDEDE